MFHINTITHRTMDTAQPLLMLTNREGYKYMIGKIPEGTQRVINQSKSKLGKLRSIFLTGISLDWLCIGGLPGLFLTISDSTKKSIEVFSGASLISYVVATWRSFVFRRGVELKLTQLQADQVVSEAQINFTPIIVSPNENSNEFPNKAASSAIKKITQLMFPMDTSKVNSENPNSYKIDHSVDDIHNHVTLPTPDHIEPSTSYRISFQPLRGKFDPKAAIALGIKPGSDFRKLSDGESVPNSKGELVHPHQVMGESKLFPEVLVIDIPSISYLDKTIAQIQQLKNGDLSEVGLVYHFLGDNVSFQSASYQVFLASFPPNCKHVVNSSEISGENCLVFKSSAINTLKLRSFQKDYFNLPRCNQETVLEHQSEFGTVIPLHMLQRFDVTVDGIFEDREKIDNKSWSELYDEHVAPLSLESKYSKEEVIDTAQLPLYDEDLPVKDQVQTITLGTGSALPSLFRNVISNLVRIPYKGKYRSILLDGGENTLGTIYRTFGSQSEDVFKELSMIYLSHLHADHHLGLVSIIKEWFKINHQDVNRKLYLVIPWQYNRFLEEWYKLDCETVDLNRIVYISCEDFLTIERAAGEYHDCTLNEFEAIIDGTGPSQTKASLISSNKDPKPINQELINELFTELNIEKISTCRAIHCYWSYSVTIKCKLDDSPDNTFTFSYSGDTRPNPKFVEIGYGSDLLIHESSLAEDLIEEALAKKHSTMIEAVTTAKLMNCPKIILTHFSARFSNKADFSVDPDQLVIIARNLRDYLSENGISKYHNILGYDEELDGIPGAPSFRDTQICYAFDLMIIRYGSITNDKLKYEDILKMFLTDDEVSDLALSEEKKNREMEKLIEKRKAKREKRMKLD